MFKGFKPQKSAYDLLFSAGLQFCDLHCQQKVINCIVLCVCEVKVDTMILTPYICYFFFMFFAYLLLYLWYCEICFTVSNGQIHFSHYDPLCFNDCQWKSVAYKCVCLCVCWLPTSDSVLSNSIAASAVCAFNLSAITQVFSGPFKYQENSRSAWLPYPNPNPDFQVSIQQMTATFTDSMHSLHLL